MDKVNYTSRNNNCNIHYTYNNDNNCNNNNDNDKDNQMNHKIYVLNTNQMKYDAALKYFNNYNYHYELLPFNVTPSNVKHQQHHQYQQQQQEQHLAQSPKYPSLTTKCPTRRVTPIPQRFSIYNPALNALQKLFKCTIKFMDKKKSSQQSYYYYNTSKRIEKTVMPLKSKVTSRQTTNANRSTSSIMSNEKFSLKSIFNSYRIEFLRKKFNFLPCLQQQDQHQQQQQHHQTKKLSMNYIVDNYWNIYCDPITNDNQLNSNDFGPMYCDLGDNCRCLDCQSTYFDFNDSDYSIESDYDFDVNDNDNETFNDAVDQELINLNDVKNVLNQNSNKLHWE